MIGVATAVFMSLDDISVVAEEFFPEEEFVTETRGRCLDQAELDRFVGNVAETVRLELGDDYKVRIFLIGDSHTTGIMHGMTLEYVFSRINLEADQAGIVQRAWCG